MTKKRAAPKKRRASRTRRTSSPWAIIVTLLLIGALGILPFASKLGHRSGEGAAGAGHPHPPSATHQVERAPGALPACREGRAWSPPEDDDVGQEPPPHDDVASLDTELLADEATQAARREHGLAALELDETLRIIARKHSEHMSQRGFFSHDDPDGRSPSDRVHDEHRTLVGEAGENIWMCRGCWRGSPGDAADTIVNSDRGWMHSPGHRDNILRESFTHTAVGIAQHGSDLWATQLFASARGRLFARIPRRIERGTCLLLEVTPFPADGDEPTAFDLAPIPGQASNVAATPLGLSRFDVPPGSYRLRFHFPITARRYAIVSGPNVEVR